LPPHRAPGQVAPDPSPPQPTILTERTLAVLASVAEALTGHPAGAGAARAVAPLAARLPPADRRQLALLLAALERLGGLAGGARRFSSLPAERRARLLAALAGSRLAPLRQAAAALRSLSMLGTYGQEETWEEVGYRGPWLGRRAVEVVPAPDFPSSDRPDRLGTTCSLAGERGRLRLSAAVCVVGTGAGGGAAFAALAAAGVDVVAVEAGELLRTEQLTQRELEMLPLLYRDGGLRSTRDQAIGILQGTGAGGSTLHNTGLVVPPPPAILERWRRGHAFPWGEAEVEEAVAGVLAALGATPIPASEINANNALLRRGAEALGWRSRVALHNRVSCSACGYCMLGCAYNRKANAAFAFLAPGLRAGGRLLTGLSATRLRRRGSGWEMRCRSAAGGEVRIAAERVVVAGGALETPALLRRSGLGGGGVGEGLRLHPAAVLLADFDEPVRAWRGLPQAVLVEEHATFLEGGRGGFLLLPTASNWPATVAVALPGSGAEHRRRMQRLPHLASAAVLLHDEGSGRVSATRAGRPRADYRLAGGDTAALGQGIGALARLWLAAGARRVFLPFSEAPAVTDADSLERVLARASLAPHRVALNSVHPQGSCRLSAGGPVGPGGELRGAPGVYVADASLFPTSVGVPPQVTTMALGALVGRAAAGAPR
jgi:choline dehydrogenase-like flavoprotein